MLPTPVQIGTMLSIRTRLTACRLALSGDEPSDDLPFDNHLREAIHEFIELAGANDFMVPFDWPSWHEDALQYFEGPEMLDAASLGAIQKLITFHVRKERFCEGHLPEMVRSGHICSILRRLSELSSVSAEQ